MKVVRIWRWTFWARLTESDAWGIEAGVEYRRRPVHLPGAVGFKEWAVSFTFNECKPNEKTDR